MIYEFNEIVENQINFYYKNEGNICDFTEYDSSSYINHRNTDRIFRYGNEIISDNSVKNQIIEYIEDLRNSGEEAYLSTSTINYDEYEFHPLVNLHIHWYDYLMRSDITWNVDSGGTPAFPHQKFDYKKKLVFDKNIKSIISVRKDTHFRDYLFSKINKDNNSIFRYAKYQNDARKESESDTRVVNDYPKWDELLSEYNNSIISFVVETEKNIEENLNCQISEKTIVPFLSGNIVILLGRYGNIKALEDIGLYVWNKEFGFTADMCDNHYDRVDDFVKIYNKIKNLSFDECKKIWLDNQYKIQKNYDIVSNLVTKKWN